MLVNGFDEKKEVFYKSCEFNSWGSDYKFDNTSLFRLHRILELSDRINFFNLLPQKLIEYINGVDLINKLIENYNENINSFSQNLFFKNKSFNYSKSEIKTISNSPNGIFTKQITKDKKIFLGKLINSKVFNNSGKNYIIIGSHWNTSDPKKDTVPDQLFMFSEIGVVGLNYYHSLFSEDKIKPEPYKEYKTGNNNNGCYVELFWDEINLDLEKTFFTNDGKEFHKKDRIFKMFSLSSKKPLFSSNFFWKNFEKILSNEICKVEVKTMGLLYEQKLKTKEEIQKDVSDVISDYDKNNDGILDIIEGDNEFELILKKYNKEIVDLGKDFNENYIHKFVKLNNYIKQKKSNFKLIIESIKNVNNGDELNNNLGILNQEIYRYNIVLLNSLNMLVSLIEGEQLIFYELYEKFDKLNIFNTNWENEVSGKLTSIIDGIEKLNYTLQDLMFEIKLMGKQIEESLNDLTTIQGESVKKLELKLGEIDSTLKVGNLISVINTYQTYKINKNTKSLRQ